MDTKRVAPTLTCMTILLGLANSGILADLPADQTVQYIIRETPNDPDSAIVFGVEFALTAVSTNGASVAWEVAELVLIEIDSNGAAANEWADSSPTFATSNGLWCVEHNDPESPVLAEFDMPPWIVGTAKAEDQNEDDLEYTIEGENCNASCQQLFGGNVGALDYEFTRVGEQNPLRQAIDGTVKIDEDNLPPVG